MQLNSFELITIGFELFSGGDGSVKVGVLINIHKDHQLAIPCMALRLLQGQTCCNTTVLMNQVCFVPHDPFQCL